jgi:energy-coupling factor transporter transmembrane protein EcfT
MSVLPAGEKSSTNSGSSVPVTLRGLMNLIFSLLNRVLKATLRPASALIVMAFDASRSKTGLVLEKALLRHQLALLNRPRIHRD